MANAVIKHFRRYEYLISNDVITLAKTKVEITSAFSDSLRISINRKKWLRLERLKCVRNRSIFEFFRSSAHHYQIQLLTYFIWLMISDQQAKQHSVPATLTLHSVTEQSEGQMDTVASMMIYAINSTCKTDLSHPQWPLQGGTLPACAFRKLLLCI